MTDVEFEWDEGNRGKVEDHNLDIDEVEDAFYDKYRIPIAARNVRGERRWALIGATATDRVVFVVYTRRDDKIRVVTAYPASPKEQQTYRDRRS